MITAQKKTITYSFLLFLIVGGIMINSTDNNIQENNFDETFEMDIIKIPNYAGTGDFLSTWDTLELSTGSSANDQIKLPLVSSGSYNFLVDWGDGQTDTITSPTDVAVIHTYSLSGVYTINITGTIVGWQFNDDGDRLKLLEI